MNYRQLMKMQNPAIRDAILDIDPDYESSIDDMDEGRLRRLLGTLTIPEELTDRSDTEDQYSSPGIREAYAPWRWMYFDFPDVYKTLYYDEVGYITGSKNKMTLLIHLVQLSRDAIPLLTEYEQVALCGLCGGSSGGCPGYAPRFDTLKKDVSKLYVIAVSFDQAWAMTYGYTKSWKYTVMYGDRLSQAYTRRIMSKVSDLGVGLGLGSCDGKCKICPVMTGDDSEHRKCIRPDKRSFSMEATGIDCDALHKMLYGEYMPWGFIGLNKSPLYLTRYSGVLTTKSAGKVTRTLKEQIITDKSYIPELPVTPEYEVEEIATPTGVHKGYMQFMYNLKPEKVEQV